MTTAMIVTAAREMLLTTLLLVSPFLLVSILASLAIGLFQASTRMNDLTLSFVPRFFAVLLLSWLLLNWAGGRVSAYLERSAATAATLTD
ncbi:MAG TPA: flagellar biosynthetic protein FliQ [Stellaceae bacterium]|jgi:flagellar biosynthetic protein FliQ|nr:flagellar biosynthetic protein FliQ [Stellaceae bacterium]